MERVKKGEKYWYLEIEEGLGISTDFTYDSYDPLDNNNLETGNYFHTKEEAETVAEKIRAVLAGADIIEDWQKEKINSWDAMLETKNEMSNAVDKYWKLRINPKINAVLKGADVIQMPSEMELQSIKSEIENIFSPRSASEAAYIGATKMEYFFKSKIVK